MSSVVLHEPKLTKMDIKNLIDKIESIQIENDSLKKRFDQFLIDLISFVDDSYSLELLEKIEDFVIYDTIIKNVNRPHFLPILEFIKKDLWEQMGDGFEFSYVVDEKETLEVRVTKCPLVELFQESNAEQLGYALYCSWDIGYCKALNPKLEFERTKTLMLGDSYCNHCYKLNKENL